MLLVTGGTGLSGTAVVREFARRGIRVRVLVRSAAKARAFAAMPAVETVVGDMLRPDTLGPALRDVHRVLMISSPRERMVQTQCTFVDAAKAAGVAHVVKFSGKESGIGFDANAFRGTRQHEEIERHLERSGLAWTHLRPSQFMQFYLPGTLTGVDPRERALVLPIGHSRLAPVDIEDIAKVSVALMTGEGHEGKAYEITGPDAVTMTEAVEHISAATGVPFRYVDVSPAEKRQRLEASGLPPETVDLLDELFAERSRRRDSDVRLATHRRFGVEPTTFARFARRHAEAFLAPVLATCPSKRGKFR
ncbi:SDR family oxidoreductase [Kutzneria sp. CA-103260]|uniref:SDR family oxidoreductase n=1 Tax=Kutzneria sp. CA-103260 TaxID=2802641 RepID=UPI001BA5E21C|nr:SDR family oxidoreductase [Kutzneria sp. CA-103260]QUQ65314.1 nucleotide-diphosphate-sugar epimerase/NmrA family protein [Kutzneria sp. CA-103260]